MSNQGASFFSDNLDSLMPSNRPAPTPNKVSLALNKTTVENLNIPDIQGRTRDLTGPGGIAVFSSRLFCGGKACKVKKPEDASKGMPICEVELEPIDDGPKGSTCPAECSKSVFKGEGCPDIVNGGGGGIDETQMNVRGDESGYCTE